MNDTNYFKTLNKTLKNHERAIPCLLIDLDILEENIQNLKSSLNEKKDFRIVVKSLPSPELLQFIMSQAGTQKLMVFHQPFLSDLANRLDTQADILLGKPMPVKTAHYFYKKPEKMENGFNPFLQIQWLVDTKERIEEYLGLAKSLKQKIRVNLELDVGLRRGGFDSLDHLREGLKLLKDNQDLLEFSGFMGYDPHVVKLPKIIRSPQKALQLANDFYSSAKELLKKEFADLVNDKLTFNGAGSPTFELHQTNDSPLNDLAAGSFLLKPTTFDIPSLKNYKAACFIATPVLKKFKGTRLPGLENMKGFLSFLDKYNQNSYFIYGGFWKADYCHPEGIQQNKIFGASTNQTMLNAPSGTELEIDDFVFLRPHQSEFVLLQFGRILAIRKGEIVEEWSLLKQ